MKFHSRILPREYHGANISVGAGRVWVDYLWIAPTGFEILLDEFGSGVSLDGIQGEIWREELASGGIFLAGFDGKHLQLEYSKYSSWSVMGEIGCLGGIRQNIFRWYLIPKLSGRICRQNIPDPREKISVRVEIPMKYTYILRKGFDASWVVYGCKNIQVGYLSDPDSRIQSEFFRTTLDQISYRICKCDKFVHSKDRNNISMDSMWNRCSFERRSWEQDPLLIPVPVPVPIPNLQIKFWNSNLPNPIPNHSFVEKVVFMFLT